MRRSSRLGADEPLFLSWMTPIGSGLRKEVREFESFAKVLDNLDGSRPVHVQTSDSNCALFALWTAIDVATITPLPIGIDGQPAFVSNTKCPPVGLMMRDLHDKSSVQNILAQLGLKTTPKFAKVKPLSLVIRSLERGPLVVGAVINMFDDRNHVRTKLVKREFTSGKWGSCMIMHSVCVVGLCSVSGQAHYILKDTQDLEELGDPTTGCSFVPVNEMDIGEMYVLERLETTTKTIAVPFPDRNGNKRKRKVIDLTMDDRDVLISITAVASKKM